MLIDFAAVTHQGRVRKNNEDAFLVSALDGEEPSINTLKRSPLHSRGALLAAVADGMGGAAAGEIASREGLASIAVNLFARWACFPMALATEERLLAALVTAVDQASQAVLRYSEEDRTARGMGCTLTATVIWNSTAYIGQVGDSRAYLYRASRLVPLTQDQTLVNEMLETGLITPEEAKRHPQRSMITQALGSPKPVKAALTKLVLRRGDRLLLCSDGLHGEAPDELLGGILFPKYSLRRSIEMMIQAALDHGGRDNITALLLGLDDPALPLAEPGEDVVVQSLGIPPDLGGEPSGLLTRLGRVLTGKS